MYEILLYTDSNDKSEIEEYINELKTNSDKESMIKLEKITAYMNRLKEKGLLLGMPYIKYLGKDIWELRPIKDRILFAYYKDNIFVLLSIFRKESQKTPKKEILKAKKRLKEFIRRWKDNA